MIVPPTSVQVLVATTPLDFRKGMDGLAAFVQEQLGCDPYSGVIYVFRAKRVSFTSFHIPIALCSDRVPLASVARKAIETHPADAASRPR